MDHMIRDYGRYLISEFMHIGKILFALNRPKDFLLERHLQRQALLGKSVNQLESW